MIERVTERSVFRRFRSDGVRTRSGPITIIRVERPDAAAPAVAFAVSRRVGSAVVRNRVRRQLRAAFRELASLGLLHGDAYLVIPGPHAARSDMTTLRGWIAGALDLPVGTLPSTEPAPKSAR